MQIAVLFTLFAGAVAAAGVGVGAVAFVIAFAVNLAEKHHRELQDGQLTVESLNDASPAACLEIKSWLEDDDIAAFRQSVVVDQGRRFLVCEVAAMKAFFESADARKSDRDRNLAIEKACHEVYLSPLMDKSSLN